MPRRRRSDVTGTVGNTPVVRINRLAPKHVEMYAKCEFFNPLSSVKDRLAVAIIEHAERTVTPVLPNARARNTQRAQPPPPPRIL